MISELQIAIAQIIDSQAFEKEHFSTLSNMNSRRKSALDKADKIIQMINKERNKKTDNLNDARF